MNLFKHHDIIDKCYKITKTIIWLDMMFPVPKMLVTCDRGEDDRLSYMQQRLDGKSNFNIHDIYFDGEKRDQIQYGDSFGVGALLMVNFNIA